MQLVPDVRIPLLVTTMTKRRLIIIHVHTQPQQMWIVMATALLTLTVQGNAEDLL